jgi:uncharacterized protein (DUF1330 family)
MSAYIITFVDIHDRTRFAQDYIPPVASTLEPFGGRVIAASDETTTLEGSVPPGRTVLLEFPDVDSARRWYASDEYAPLLALCTSITTSSAALLPGGFTLHD